jgi:hypothetical protein
MKLTLPSATLTTLLSSGEVVVSKAQSVSLANAAMIIKKEAKVQGADTEIKGDTTTSAQVDWDSKFTCLKEKLKAKLDLRKTMWSRDVHLVKTEKEYIPFGSPAYQLGKDETSDLGSLMC